VKSDTNGITVETVPIKETKLYKQSN